VPPTASNSSNNTVQIAIQVVDANSAATINKVKTEIVGLDAEAKKVSASTGAAGASVDQMSNNMRAAASAAAAAGAAGSAAGDQIAHGMKRGMNEVTRMRADLRDIGITIDKVFAHELAENLPMIPKLISAFGGAFFALGLVEMFSQMAEGAKKVYEEQVLVNKAIDEYIMKAGQAAQKKLFDTASVETTKNLLSQVNDEIDKLEQKKSASLNAMVNSGVSGQGAAGMPAMGGYSSADSKFQAELMADRDALSDRSVEQIRDRDRARLQADNEFRMQVAGRAAKADVEFMNSRLEAQRKLNQAKAEELQQFNRIKAAYDLQQSKIAKGEFIAPQDLVALPKLNQNAGQEQYEDALHAAEMKRSADRIAAAREERDAEISMHNEAVNAALRGEQLYAMQRIQQEDAIRRKVEDGNLTRAQGLKKIADIDLRYHNERMKRLQEEREATARMQRDADQSGLTGIAKIQAEGANRNLETIAAARKSGDFSQVPQRLSINSQMTDSEVQRATQEYYQHLREMREEYISGEMQGFARIEAEARRPAQTLRDEFSKTWGQVGANDPGRVAAQQQLNQDLVALDQKSARDREKLTRRNADETLKLEEEAARHSMLPEQQKTQQIVDEYHERLRRYKEMLDDQMISQQDFDRRVVAAQRDMNAELLEQQRQMRDKLAGELQGLFRNPAQWMQGIGEKMAAQFAASMLMKTGAGRSLEHGMDPRTAVDSITGIFHPRPHGTPPFIDPRYAGPQGTNTAQMPKILQLPGVASHTMQVASAVIQVQNGQIVGGLGGSAFGGLMPVGSGSNIPGALGGGLGTAGSASATSSTLGASSMGGGYTSADSTGGVMSNIQGGVGAAQQGYGLLKGLGAFGGVKGAGQSEGGFGAGIDGSSVFVEPNGPGQAGTQGGLMNTLGGLAGGGMALFGAYKSSGGFGGMMQGALGGAMIGAKLGMMVGGPVGALIGAGLGAIGGAVMGFMGFGGRAKAEAYDKKQVRPRMRDDLQNFEQGSMDYLSAYADLDNLMAEAKKQTKQFGRGGESYYNDTIKPELQQAQQKLTREAKAGRSQFTMSGAEFHSGGWINGFGDLGTTDTEGFIHAMQGEFVLHRQAAQANSSVLPLMQSGLNVPQLLKGQQTLPAMRSTNATWNVHTIDRRGVAQFLDDYKHDIRAALNNSRGEYSGEAEA
jgi:hypothetical protein